jgi:hypothetical protein
VNDLLYETADSCRWAHQAPIYVPVKAVPAFGLRDRRVGENVALVGEKTANIECFKAVPESGDVLTASYRMFFTLEDFNLSLTFVASR